MEQPAGEDPTSAVEVGAKPAESIVGALWNEWPWSAQWCWRFTILQIMFAVIGHLCFEVGPLYKTVNVDEIELFTVARYVLIIPLIFITLLHLRERCRPRARHRALVISFVSMWEFSVKITYYTLLSEGYGLAFQNQRSFDYRPIYATRWMGWFFAIPTLLFMNLYPIMEDYPASAVVKRIFPQQACSAAYCWTCYLGCIIYDPWFGWFLNILGCVGYVVVIVDEAVLVAEHMISTKQPILKGYSIIVKECIFVMYTCVWLMGCWSYTGSYAVQRFYTVSDVSLKATMSGLMFLYWNTEDYFGPAVKKDE